MRAAGTARFLARRAEKAKLRQVAPRGSAGQALLRDRAFAFLPMKQLSYEAAELAIRGTKKTKVDNMAGRKNVTSTLQGDRWVPTAHVELELPPVDFSGIGAAEPPLVWNKKLRSKWYNLLVPQRAPCIDEIHLLLQARQGPSLAPWPDSPGSPVSDYLGSPSQHPEHPRWFRCAFLPAVHYDWRTACVDVGDETGANWQTAWHGTCMTRLWSILYYAGLANSECDAHDSSLEPGVFLSHRRWTASGYCVWQPLFDDNVFWRCLVEVQCDSNKLLECRRPHQWLIKSQYVFPTAFWFCSEPLSSARGQDRVRLTWTPAAEFVPHPLRTTLCL